MKTINLEAPYEIVKADAAEAKSGRKFTGVAYSGDPVSYWGGPVVIDLSSTEDPGKIGVLLNHAHDKRAGFTHIDNDGRRLAIRDGRLMGNEHGKAVAFESDEGFPWNLSVRVESERVEEVKAGAPVDVNGRSFTGPMTILRGNSIREVSFTPVGADPNTIGLAASRPSDGESTPKPTEEQAMPDEKKTAELTALQDQVAKLTAGAAESKARADKAEAELTAMREATRKKAVAELFADMGREFTDEAAAPYLKLGEAEFEAVAADVRLMKPKAPDALFERQAALSAGDNAAGGAAKPGVLVTNAKQRHGLN